MTTQQMTIGQWTFTNEPLSYSLYGRWLAERNGYEIIVEADIEDGQADWMARLYDPEGIRIESILLDAPIEGDVDAALREAVEKFGDWHHDLLTPLPEGR